jgi:hypothetical protein
MTHGATLLNIKELALELNRPYRTVRRWVTLGKCPIPAIPNHNPAKFRVVDVEAFTGRPVKAGVK